MKKIFFSILTALLCMVSYAQTPDAVYKLLRQEWTVNADGTSDYHYRHEVQILRNRALVAYADKGETFVVYNPDLEEVTVNEVYTLQSDGTRVNMPQNAFVYQLPSQCTDCGRFNHLRELVMVHTGMELGCTVVVDYTIHRRYDLVNQTLDLVRECPVERLEINVKVPEGHDLHVQLADPKVLTFIPTEEQTATTYSLKATNVPQMFVDNYLPAKEQLYPTLHFYNGVPEFIPAFDQQGLAEASSVTGQLTDSREDRVNIAAIQNYVIDNIHLNDIAPSHLGYKHATAAEVWQTGCGTATDKAVLLAAMLNQDGYSARVIGENYDEVGVMIDTIEYRLNVRRKGPMTLYGEAKDEVTPVVYNRNHTAYKLDTLEGGFYRLPFTRIQEAPAISAGRLAMTRVAPLNTPMCDINVHDEYPLPKGMKMVGNTIARTLSFEGIGSVEVGVKQKGKTLVVDRKLKIEKGVIAPSEYANYRQMLTIWQEADAVMLRSK